MVRKGDLISYYHSGKEKQIVGIIKALGDAYSTDKQNQVSTSIEVAVEVAPIEKFAKPVTLRKIKMDSRFSDFLLVRISRLSVMPVSHEQWRVIKELSET